MNDNHTEWVRLADLPDEHVGPREEDVKFKVVVPILRLLGFIDTDFSFETPADLGRIDITIKGFRVGVIAECKGPRVRLDGCVPQLEKYVRETMTRHHVAMLSLLTNGNRFMVFGVLGAIHKNELSDQFLFEFWRNQLKDIETQERIASLLSRSVIETGIVREAIEATLEDRRHQQQKRQEDEDKGKALLAQKEALIEQIRTLDAQMANLTPIHSPDTSDANLYSDASEKPGFKWSKEFGSTEVVCGWINDILERLAPVDSADFVHHARVAEELCTFLEGRGSERAKALSKKDRLFRAGNMIDWITARWTTALGGKDSPQMQSDPGAEISDPKEKTWLKAFTHVWTRKLIDNWAFRRR